MKNKPATTGEIAKGKSIILAKKVFPLKSYFVKSHAEATPKIVLNNTAATVASKVSIIAFTAIPSVSEFAYTAKPFANASFATKSKGKTSIIKIKLTAKKIRLILTNLSFFILQFPPSLSDISDNH